MSSYSYIQISEKVVSKEVNNNFNFFQKYNTNLSPSLRFNNLNFAIVINSNEVLTNILSGSFWSPSGFLNAGSSTKSYGFQVGNSIYIILIKNNYIQPNLYLRYITSVTTTPIFTKSFIALFSSNYSLKSTASSMNNIIINNKNSYSITLNNFKFYLGSTSTSSFVTNPAKVLITNNGIFLPINSQKYLLTLNTDTITLEPGKNLNIILNYSYNIEGLNYGLTHSSILLIDLIGLLYRPVTYYKLNNIEIGLILSLSSNYNYNDPLVANNFYYNNLLENKFNVNFKPTNVNAENLNSQKVSFNIIDSSGNIIFNNKDSSGNIIPVYGEISSGTTSFTIPPEYIEKIITEKTYSAFINYNPNDSYNLSYQATNSSPGLNHYLEGKSNYISFTVNKQKTMITNTNLNTSYSVLKEYTFTNFKLMDSVYTSKNLSSTVTGKIKLTFVYPGTTNLTYESSTGSNISNFTVNLKNIKLVPNRSYTLLIDFTPDSTFTSNIATPSSQTISNGFITETPIINISQSSSDLSYFETNTISINFKDSSGNLYTTSTNNQGILKLNIYNGPSNTLISTISSLFTLNTDNTIYTYIFSPKTMNLLNNYSSSNYSINAVYTETIIPSNISTSSFLLFTFIGVSVQQSDLSNLSNLNVYSSISLTTFLLDNNKGEKISTSSILENYISGDFKLYLGDQLIDNIFPSTTDNIKYSFTFTPNQLSLNTGNNPIDKIKIKFIPTDTNNIINSYTIPSFDLKLITPTLTLNSNINNDNNLNSIQIYSLTINGVNEIYDDGILTIYKNDLITPLDNFILSTSKPYHINITLYDLLKDVYTDNPSNISYSIGWISNNSNIYSPLKINETIELSKENITFSNISNYITKSWGDEYTITGFLSTLNGELIYGSIYLYSVNLDNTTEIFDERAYCLTAGTNDFSILLTKPIPQELKLQLKFIPTLDNIYYQSTSNNFNVKFNKIEINPKLNVYDLDSDSNADLTNPIYYTENLQIQFSNILLPPSYKINLYIKNNPNENIFTYTDDTEITIANHNININLFEYNSNNEIYSDETGPLYTIGYSIDEYNDELYYIKDSFPTIEFKNSSPSFNTIEFYDDSDSMLTNNNLIYDKDYSIKFTFNSFSNSEDSVISMIGELYINIDNNQKLIKEEYTISTTLEQISFNPKQQNLSIGTHNYYFSFVPLDPNIDPFSTGSSQFIITASSIEEISSVSFSQSDSEETSIYYQENFYASISFNNPGLDGYFEVYCVDSTNLEYILSLGDLTSGNPNNETDISKDSKLNNNKVISSNTSDSLNYYSTGDRVLKIQCNAINQDITSLSSNQDYYIYIKFISTTNTYSSKTFSYYKLTINKKNVKLDSLSLYLTSNGTPLYYNEIINIYVGDTIYIKGTVVTIDDKIVKGGSIDILTNNTISSQDLNDTFYENTENLNNNLVNSITVDDSGKFENSLYLTVESLLYLNSFINQIYGSLADIKFVYKNSKNYNLIFFNNNEDIPGYYQTKINIPTLNYTLTFENSTITNINNFYYQEDKIKFILNLNILKSNLINNSLIIYINGSNEDGIFQYKDYNLTSENFSLSAVDPSKTIGLLTINSLIGEFPSYYSPYSISADFNQNGYNISYPSNIDEYKNQIFNVIKTEPNVSLSIYSKGTSVIKSETDYETSVDLFIKVNTSQNVISNNSNSINGTFSIYLLINNGNITIPSTHPINFTYTGQTTLTDIYTFDDNNLSDNGITVTFSPKDNLSRMGITDLNSIKGFYINFIPSDTDNYEFKTKSITFTIIKYSLSLSIEDIQPYAEISNRTENIQPYTEKINDPNNPIDTIDFYNRYHRYNGFINFDEQFDVTTKLDLISVRGTYYYYYSSDLTTYAPIERSELDDINSSLISRFPSNKIPIDSDNSYKFKVEFIPDENVYYNPAQDIFSFNVYLANNFGDGIISYNSTSSSLIASYNSPDTINITASFKFNDTVEDISKKCSVQLYYIEYGSSNKTLITNEKRYLTNESKSSTFNLNSTILPTNLVNFPYTIKALFTPVTSVTSGITNSNYPVIYEQSPLNLIVKPTISITNLKSESIPKFNSLYDYSNGILFGIKFNTGTYGTFNDYNKFNLYIKGSLKDVSGNLIINKNLNSISFNPASIENNTYNTENINLDSFLIPDTYTISIYANNDTIGSISSTETITSSFIVQKFSVSLSGLIDNYYIKYGNPLTFTFTIGDYVIDNGYVNILFKNVSNSDNISISIPSSSLSKTGFNYTYTILDTSEFFDKSLPSGIYTLIYSLNNQNYTSVEYKDSSSNLFVNQNNCNLSLTYSATKITYGLNNNIVINAIIKTTDASETIIRSATLYLTANGKSIPISTTYNIISNNYSLTLPSTDLNIGINKINVYMLDKNYIANPTLKMITVTKGVPSTSTSYTITNDITTNTSSTFKIVLNQSIIDGQNIRFYTDITNSVIIPDSILGSNYTFLFSEILYGDNYIYAIINSPKFDTKTNLLKITKPLKDVTITCSLPIIGTYKSGKSIDITYVISDVISNTIPISDGFVEFYRSFAGNNELIDVVNVNNGSASLTNYVLYGDGNINNDNTTTFKIHGKYIGTNKYNNATSTDSQLTIFNQYESSIEIESILYDDNEISSEVTLKVNSNIQLNYKVTQNLETDYTDGVVEFHSIYVDSDNEEIDEILGYSTLDINFIGKLNYTLINIAIIKIYAKYINANNYNNSNTSDNLFTINVIKYYKANIELECFIKDYMINESISLKFTVRGKENNEPIEEGGVELHMIPASTEADNILNYQLLSDGEVNFTYYFYSSGVYRFYGKFLNSNNYDFVATNNTEILVLSNQTSQVSIDYDSNFIEEDVKPIIKDSNYKLGDTISLYYNIINLKNNDYEINEGSITIFKVYNYNGKTISPEIIGMYKVNDGKAGITYKLNFNEKFIIDNVKNSVSFYATYGNSKNYTFNNVINKISINVFKQYEATISNEAIITPSTNLIVGDSIEIKFIVKDEIDSDVSDGMLEFHKVFNNVDEIIGYSYLSDDNYINYTLVDAGDIYFYANFNSSINYANTTNLNNNYPVTIKTNLQYLTSTTLETSNTVYSYGTILNLTASVVGNLVTEEINDGYVNFYIVTDDTNDNNEFIGMSLIINGVTSLNNYYINKIGSIQFLASFENSIKFAESNNNLFLTLSKASPTSINISYPSTINYLDIVTIKATIDFGTDLYFSNNGTITFNINNELFEVNLIKSDRNTYIANLEQIIYDKSYNISAKFNGNDFFTSIDSSESFIDENDIEANESVYDGLIFTYTPDSLTNYIILTASLNIGNPNNINVLKNIGYMTFELTINETNLSYTYPVINGSATANLPFIYSNDYEINVTYNDKDISDISNNKITINKLFKFDNVPKAIGGNKTITTDTYKYHVFTTNDNIFFTQNTLVDYLIVAGGGAGGSNHGGGGGAGGVKNGSLTFNRGTYEITVGSGGVIDGNKSNKGGNSSLFTIESIGGGNGGGAINGEATDGGSGGGEGGHLTGIGPYGYGIIGQGYDGGSKSDDSNSAGSGGGGSGGNGFTYTNQNKGGLGGNGTSSFDSWLKDISSTMSDSWINATKYSNNGSDIYYIGGGGAGGSWYDLPTSGSLGGGGNGGSYINGPPMPTAGIDNTGSGGGGGGAGGQYGAKGGSGLVIIRYTN